MNEVEAKLVLSNYTLGEPPVDDSRFDEALKVAEADPELMAWWNRAKENDAVIQGRLRSFEPPPDLRAALGASMENASKKRYFRRTLTRYLALAASLVVVTGIYFQFIVDRSDEYTGPLVDRAFNYSFDGPRLKYFNKDTTKITDWLVGQNFDLPPQLPPRFLAQEGIGCRPLNWSDSMVAIICVDAEVVYHLFVAKGEEFEEVNLSDTFEYEKRKAGWTVSKWESQGHVFVLTAKASQERMDSMLAEYSP